MPADPGAELARLAVQRSRLHAELRELQAGSGDHQSTEAGRAARRLAEARENLEHASRRARSSDLSRRHRRRADGEKRAEVETAEKQWRLTGYGVEQRIIAAIEGIDDAVSALEARRHHRAAWHLEHPAAARRLDALARQIATLEHQAGISAPEPPHRPPPAIGGLSL